MVTPCARFSSINCSRSANSSAWKVFSANHLSTRMEIACAPVVSSGAATGIGRRVFTAITAAEDSCSTRSVGHRAEGGGAVERLGGRAKHHQVVGAAFVEDGLCRILRDGDLRFHFGQALQHLFQTAKGRIGAGGAIGGEVQRGELAGTQTQPNPQRQLGMRAAAHRDQYTRRRLGERPPHERDVARGMGEHLRHGNAKRVQMALPFQQQEIGFFRDDHGEQIGPRHGGDVHPCFAADLAAGRGQFSQLLADLPRR
ncbi:MAG: hypothetical protein HW418_2419 [Anaerolineales bacterium]|nr:hypothetical protein [Anaerolineales bacterium]